MQVYNKLVRDGIPEQIINNRSLLDEILGVKPHVHTLSDEEFKLEIRKKLVEEMAELIAGKKREDILAELADVYEVLDALRRSEGIGDTEVLNERAKKTACVGDFSKKIFLETVG